MENILFFDYINDNVKYAFLSQNSIVINKRNKLIYFTFFQVFSSLFGMLYVIIRKARIYLFVNLITIFLAINGLIGSITINSIFLLIHCVFTISIGIAFFLYSIISDIFTSDSRYEEKSRISEHVLLYIFSLPFLYDIFCAYYNYSWLVLLSGVNKKDSYNIINNENNDYNENLLNDNNKKIEMDEINNKRNSNINECQICCERNKNTVFTPCGHSFCCDICWNLLKIKTNQCPMCRKQINDCIKIYN